MSFWTEHYQAEAEKKEMYGQPEPPYVKKPAEWDWKNAPFGLFLMNNRKYRCPGCGRCFFRKSSYLACHPEYRRYIRWQEAHRGTPILYTAPVQQTESVGPHFSPYPGGTYGGGPGVVRGSAHGGAYVTGSPYPGGPNAPVYSQGNDFIGVDNLPPNMDPRV